MLTINHNIKYQPDFSIPCVYVNGAVRLKFLIEGCFPLGFSYGSREELEARLFDLPCRYFVRSVWRNEYVVHGRWMNLTKVRSTIEKYLATDVTWEMTESELIVPG